MKSQTDRVRTITSYNKAECIAVCKGSESNTPKLRVIRVDGPVNGKGIYKVGVQITFLAAASAGAKSSRAEFQLGLGEKEFTIASLKLALHSGK